MNPFILYEMFKREQERRKQEKEKPVTTDVGKSSKVLNVILGILILIAISLILFALVTGE